MQKKILLLSFLLSSAILHTKDEWKQRTIYQIITDRFYRTDASTEGCADIHKYCGGSFKGMQSQLDYIKNMGFDAIWISPIPENYGDDYHGYAALDWYKVNSHFGSEQDLQDLITAAHEKGIWVMLDVVANHVAYIDEQYQLVSPFNDSSHYHTKCQINNWDDHNEVEYCRLSNLPDLNQDNQWVRQTLLNWIKDTVAKFNFDGIRVDTVPHVKKPFWKEWASSAGVYQVGEVFNGDIGWVSNFQKDGLDAVMNYPLYFSIKTVFNYKQSMYNLRTTIQNEQGQFPDVGALGVFVDNHDNPRFLSITGSWALFKSAMTFALFTQGIPIIYYGSEQGYAGGADPNNRETLWTSKMSTDHELYKFITKAVSARKTYKVWNEQYVERWCDDSFFAFTRGNLLVALTNNDQGSQKRDITYHPYQAGQKLCNLIADNDCVTVSSDNKVSVTLNNGEVKIFVPSTSEEQFLQE